MNSFLNEYVVIRGNWSGVHLGTLKAKYGQEVFLTEARRLDWWEGAFSLHEVADMGVRCEDCRFSITIPEKRILDAIEIIPVNPDLIETFKNAEAYNAESVSGSDDAIFVMAYAPQEPFEDD